jgi:hypothetical protein
VKMTDWERESRGELKMLLCEGANRWSCDTQRNTCATSYVTADNSRPMANPSNATNN